MTDQPDKPTPPKAPLVWPPNCREVPGVPMAFVGATSMGAGMTDKKKPLAQDTDPNAPFFNWTSPSAQRAAILRQQAVARDSATEPNSAPSPTPEPAPPEPK
jgi:hypothetical protein